VDVCINKVVLDFTPNVLQASRQRNTVSELDLGANFDLQPLLLDACSDASADLKHTLSYNKVL
jgi:hypothetical protein